MTSMFVEPQFVASAASDVSNIGSLIGTAKAAAADPTTTVVAAAEDEVSAVTAAFFGSYGQQYQALLRHAAAFHDQFAAALAGAQAAYLEAETTAMLLLGGGGAAASPAVGADPALPTLNTPITGLFIGGSGLPIPPPSYLAAVLPWVNFNGTNIVSLANALPVFTPEGAQPIYSGIKSLPLNTSVGQGVTILENTINQQLFPTGEGVTPAPSVTVLGYSQSAIISSLVMRDLLNGTYPFTPPSTSQLNFTLLGDLMAPNGGIFERFVGLTLPSLGVDFYGATPPNTPYGTSIYTLEYDGFADFPQYPINFLSDLNAFAGIY
ncbi:MAG TPA: PE-PPE domain-containing protein, partial [Mycobacterium sp.]|nr:PE-PPE domain-containing protein [Mycobacterium sp.]